MNKNSFSGKGVQVIATGSVDGVLTTAAFLRVIGNPENVGIEFTQAFQVDKLDPIKRTTDSQVVFVDLAVNNKDESMTVDFVQRIQVAGYTIVAVIDEHDADAWHRVLGDEVFSALVIKPQSQKTGPFKSSGAILLDALGDEVDDHTRELCQAADAGDRMDFTTHFGGYANKSVKSAIWDNNRRVHLARWFAENREPDEKIIDWCKEYDAILVTHEEVLSSRDDLGDGIVRLDCAGKTVDMTTLMGSVYDLPGVMVCIVRGEMFNPAKKAKMVMSAFGTRIKDFDILTVVKNEGVLASGFASKANVELESEAAAIEAVKKAITDFNSAEDALVIIRGAMNVSAELEKKFREIFEEFNDWAYTAGCNGPGVVPGKKGNFLWLTIKEKTADKVVFDYNGGPNAIWGTITVTPIGVEEKAS